ncbi:MAG: HAMP domain-containing protein [Rhodopseudomonas sp.]|nr:HAMP domain-containing protein [Rhodopseudomonas sp.]
MLSRLSINVLLKATIGSLSVAVIAVLIAGAWGSWTRLSNANHLAYVAEASTQLFTGLHNLRVDRAASNRDLRSDKSNGLSSSLAETRGAEMPALRAGLIALHEAKLPDGAAVEAALKQAIDRLEALHAESVPAFSLPKASRPPNLAKDLFDHISSTMDLLDRISTELANSVKLEDAYVDQLMLIKQLAWTARNGAGDSSVMITNGIGGIAPPPDALVKYATSESRTATAWNALNEVAAGLTLPAQFAAAVRNADQEFFGPDYVKLRMDTLKGILAGQKSNLSSAEWSKVAVAKLASLLRVAEVALQVVRDHAAERRSSAEWSLAVELILLVLAGGLTGSVLLLISSRVTMPLRQVQDGMLKIAGGNFNVTLPRIERSDEVGLIVNAVGRMVEQVRTAIAEIKSSSREVTHASAEIASSTTDLSQRTEEQAASLEETSASMEEISTTVRRNAENAQAATQSAMATREVADRGGEVAARAVKAMAQIEESSRKISDIISVIDEIARQTNLLALNAAVEAARAGEAGRGFAVVASEVRSLAQRSSQAAKDIAQLITTSGSQVQEGVGLVNQAGEALNEIVESIRTVASVVADIATASAEQATGLDEIKRALTQMDEATQQNSALVEENAATSQILEQQARAMDEQVAFFQVEGENADGGQGRPVMPAAPRTATASGQPAAGPARRRRAAA